MMIYTNYDEAKAIKTALEKYESEPHFIVFAGDLLGYIVVNEAEYAEDFPGAQMF